MTAVLRPCYDARMVKEVSVRQLRNETAAVVAAVQQGQRVVLTANRKPVADIVPHVMRESPWRPASVLRNLVHDAPADPGLLADLDDVRGALIE